MPVAPGVDYGPLRAAVRGQYQDQIGAIGAIAGVAQAGLQLGQYFVQKDKATETDKWTLALNEEFATGLSTFLRQGIDTGRFYMDEKTGELVGWGTDTSTKGAPGGADELYAAFKERIASDPKLSAYRDVRGWVETNASNLYTAAMKEAVGYATERQGKVQYALQAQNLGNAEKSDIARGDLTGAMSTAYINAMTNRTPAEKQLLLAATIENIRYGVAQNDVRTTAKTEGYAAALAKIDSYDFAEDQKVILRNAAGTATNQTAAAWVDQGVQAFTSSISDAGHVPTDTEVTRWIDTNVPLAHRDEVRKQANAKITEIRSEMSRVADKELSEAFATSPAAARTAFATKLDANGMSYAQRLDNNDIRYWNAALKVADPIGSISDQNEARWSYEIAKWVRDGKPADSMPDEKAIIAAIDAGDMDGEAVRRLQTALHTATARDDTPKDTYTADVEARIYTAFSSGVDPAIAVRAGAIEADLKAEKITTEDQTYLLALRDRLHREFIQDTKGKTTEEGETEAFQIVYHETLKEEEKRAKIKAMVEAGGLSGSDGATWLNRIDPENGDPNRRDAYKILNAYYSEALKAAPESQKKKLAVEWMDAMKALQDETKREGSKPEQWRDAARSALSTHAQRAVEDAVESQLRGQFGDVGVPGLTQYGARGDVRQLDILDAGHQQNALTQSPTEAAAYERLKPQIVQRQLEFAKTAARRGEDWAKVKTVPPSDTDAATFMVPYQGHTLAYRIQWENRNGKLRRVLYRLDTDAPDSGWTEAKVE